MTEMNQLLNSDAQKTLQALLENFQMKHFKNYSSPQQIASNEDSSEEYNPNDTNHEQLCENCDSPVMIIGFTTECKQCGLVGENPNFVQLLPNYGSYSYNIKSCEEREAELKVNYANLSIDCQQLFTKFNLEQNVIESIIAESIKRLKKLDKTNITVMTKLFVSILYEVCQELKLPVPKKTIYQHFNVQVKNHSQYLKKASQIIMKFKELPTENKMKVNEVLNTYDLYQLLFSRLRRYCSSANLVVFNLICSFMGFSGDQPLFKNTTNSIVIEYPQIANLWMCNYYGWKELIEAGLPKSLVEMRSRSFNIDFTQSPPYFTKIKNESKSLMNTAVNLKIKGIVSDKFYTLKLFSKGKIVIAGVTNSYEQSEISLIIHQLFTVIFKQNKIPYSPPSVVKTTLSNFSTHIPIGFGNLIDITQASLNLKNKEEEIQELCNQNNTILIGHKIINHRIYLDLAIEKKQMPFFIHNTESTSNLKSHRSVQFIFTQQGKMLIQGADDNLINTVHVRKVFSLIFDQFVAPFIYGQNKQNTASDDQLDFDELTQLLAVLKPKIENDEQIDMIRNIWTYFQKNHILAEHSIKVKYRYFMQILDISRLVTLNEGDSHQESHDFNPLSYITSTKTPFKAPIQPVPKINTLDICFKCVINCRKNNKIQNPGFMLFLNHTLNVPELQQSFVQLLRNIITAITKTTKKPKNEDF